MDKLHIFIKRQILPILVMPSQYGRSNPPHIGNHQKLGARLWNCAYVDDNEYIIRGLTRYSSHNDIIMALCRRGGYKWDEAADFVHRVELENIHRIQIRQWPFLILTGIAMIVAGMVIISYSLYSWLGGELMPLTLTLWFFEFYFPNGGQLVGVAVAGILFLGGVGGILLAVQKGRKSAGFRNKAGT